MGITPHGDLSQNQRDLVMKSFRNRQIQMLVATDVAARGIDVDDITHVINYQLPDEIETYTHRSGRTGRAGKKGVSMVIITKSEIRKIKAIEKIISKTFVKKEVPSGMEICEMQLFHLANSIKDTEINHEIDNYLPKINEVLEGFSKEELIKKVFSVEFTRFYNYYKKAKDLNVDAGSREYEAESSKKFSDESTRFFINLGRKDDLQWMDLKDLVREITQLGKDDVFHVDTMDTFSFFNTDVAHTDKVLEAFKDVQYNDRKVDIEISKDRGEETAVVKEEALEKVASEKKEVLVKKEDLVVMTVQNLAEINQNLKEKADVEMIAQKVLARAVEEENVCKIDNYFHLNETLARN